MGDQLTGKKAIVTGGSRGIGKAIATLFALEGADVALIGTQVERGQAAASAIDGAAGRAGAARFFCADVAKSDQVDAVMGEILNLFGAIDLLVNNAAIARDGLLVRMSEEAWDRVVEVNLKSCYNFCRSGLRAMMTARRGHIINISSVVGLVGNAGQANYCATKAAVIGFTKALAKELAPRNIFVNAIAPGFIDTDMTATLSEEQRKAILSQVPLKRMGTPEEVARAALFLALSDYITGQVITVDGGMVM